MYGVEMATVKGPLATQLCAVARMSRERFMLLVEQELAFAGLGRPDGSGTRERLLAVAQSITNFPLQWWVHPQRGCGCVVGEYVVQFEGLDRTESCGTTADDVAMRAMFGGPIVDFGIALARAIERELQEAGDESLAAEVVLIEDGEGAGDE